jgi:hypothetical protein
VDFGMPLPGQLGSAPSTIEDSITRDLRDRWGKLRDGVVLGLVLQAGAMGRARPGRRCR